MNDNRQQQRPTAGVALFLTLSVAIPIWGSGCSESRPVDHRDGRIVFIDLESKKPIVADAAAEAPAVHPQTGRRTLMPALFCPTCQRWHPVPSVDQLQRTAEAAVCPDDGSPLTLDGPWPE